MFKVTVADLQEYFIAGPSKTPSIICEDGFKMSVQVGDGLYCSPRDDTGPWYKAEIGFPSSQEETIMPYIDGDENTDPTGTVYGYVPLGIIVDIINKHGGCKKITGDSK